MTVDEDFLLNRAITRYDNEVERMRQFDNKAGNQIGYVGVIIAVFGFIVGSNFQDIAFISICISIIGISILMFSILLSVWQLSPKKNNLPVLNIREFYNDWKKKKLEVDLIDVYFQHIDDMIKYNNSKLSSTRWIYVFTFIGLLISFIGVVSSLII